MEADRIIAALGLQPHLEGGWYRQTWVGPGEARASGTAILFLLKAGERSRWHRVDADEIWIFNAGAPLVLSLGQEVAREVVMGPRVLAGQQVQQVVPAGWWQAAVSTGDWTLVTCTVSPGFRFEGFELAEAGFELATG
jgi:predicted cupin superfamily sugar epimerase